jgi:hypothetical protein
MDRPLAISIVCGLFFLKYISPFVLFLIFQMTNSGKTVHIFWFDGACDFLGYAIWGLKLVGVAGIWTLRKWGVWFFFGAVMLMVARNMIGGTLWSPGFGVMGLIYFLNMFFHVLLIILSVAWYWRMKGFE